MEEKKNSEKQNKSTGQQGANHNKHKALFHCGKAPTLIHLKWC